MCKRVVILFCAVVFSLSGLIFKIVKIDAGDYAQSAARKNTHSITLETTRGKIYDCNLKPITNIYPRYYLAVKPTSIALSGIQGKLEDEQFNKLKENLKDGKPTVIALEDEIESTKDTRVVKVNKRYDTKQIAAHVIGYTNNDGNGVTGIESSYNDYLNKDSGALKAAFNVDALGRVLPGTEIELRQDGGDPNKGVVLTLNSQIQKITENALDNNEIGCGCAVVVEVGTGEIKAMASRPNFDPNKPGDYLKETDSPFINRCINEYTVGSAFKPIVACSAIEDNNISPNYRYNCVGSVEKSGVKFSCFDKDGHGVIDMRQALVKSCNTYFIDVANKMDMNELLGMCKDMGLSKSFSLADGIENAKGKLPTIDQLNSDAAIANFAFGQGKLMATPLQMASAFSTIANNGYYQEPYLVKGLIDGKGNMSDEAKPNPKKKVMSKKTASQVTSMLKTVVDEHENAKPYNTTACGKTATAQTGWFKNGKEVYHTWFVGYFPSDKPKYALAVMKEFGVGGDVDCSPVFKEIVENVTDLNS